MITGASAGVGRATAREFAKRGARIGLIARNIERLKDTAAEVRALGGDALILAGDVSDFARVDSCATELEKAFGPLDVWVNNAMVSVYAPVKLMSPDEYRRVTEVTYLGYVYGTMAALRLMLPRNRGTIVQVGSALAYRSIPLQSAYCAAKHAVAGFTESLITELLHDKSEVKVTTVHLPAINTPQFDWAKSKLDHPSRPVPPVFQPEFAAKAIVHASRHPKREYWLGFSTTKAILAEKFVPRLADRVLAKIGYKAQQSEELRGFERNEGNLWKAAPARYEAHGRFDREARPIRIPLWLTADKLIVSLVAASGFLIGSRLRRRVS